MAASSTSSLGKSLYLSRKTARLCQYDRPVIESREFYRLFPTLKRRLDQQDVTHKAAGEFLHLMKTLMAKLKVRHSLLDHYICNANVFQANDWGALTRAVPLFCSAWSLIFSSRNHGFASCTALTDILTYCLSLRYARCGARNRAAEGTIHNFLLDGWENILFPSESRRGHANRLL